MRVSLALVGLTLALAPVALEAQGSRSAGTGGTGGRAAVRPGARAERSVPSLPTAKGVGEAVNPAAVLIDKRKKLQLDEATVEQLRPLAATIGERQAQHLATYDSLRTKVHMARNRSRDGLAPSAEEVQDNRERVMLLARTMAAVRAQRDKDIEETLALVPEERREAAKALLDEQAEDLTRSFRRSGSEGAAAAGGPAGGPASGGRRP